MYKLFILTALSQSVAMTAQPVVEIVALGDSITQAYRTNVGYRYSLWTKLVDSEISFDLVGSKDANFHGNPAWSDHAGLPFDRDHEGHWGWEAGEILNGHPDLPADGELADWLESYTPDMALLHIGTNDLRHGQSVSSTVDEIGQIIELLQADNPNITVLLAKLIPTTQAANGDITLLNAELDGVAVAKSTGTSRVMVVDQSSGFDPDLDTYDGLHPNSGGEEKMALRWIEAIEEVLPTPSVPGLPGLARMLLAVGFASLGAGILHRVR